MTDVLSEEAIAELEAKLKAATPGPWQWVVNLKSRTIVLEAAIRGFEIVMDFARWGMNGARPRFQVDGLMVDAESCAVVVPGREHHASWHQTLKHPDAELICATRNALPALLATARRCLQATRFSLNGAHQGPNEMTIEWRGKDQWAVLRRGYCLNRSGEWEYEPLPSSRDDGFITRTRYSLDEAFTCGLAALTEETP